MAVTMTGPSSLTKPTGVPDTTVWMETDTGKVYQYSAGTATWSVILTTVAQKTSLMDSRSGLTGTDAAPITIASPSANTAYFIVACFTDVGATPSGTDTYKVTWTDWGSNARNITLSATAAANLTQEGTAVAQVKGGTNVQVQITAIGTGSTLDVTGATMPLQ